MEKEKREIIEIREISSLISDQGMFESHGYSFIGVEKDDKKLIYKIPITTKGLDKLREALESLAPRPPVMERIVKADSEDGKKLGYEKDTGIIFYDFTDDTYMNALKEHGRGVLWRTVIAGMEVKFNNLEKNTFEAKKAALIAHGITEKQVRKIYRDIMALTKFQEDREDFLPGKASA